MYCSDLDTQKSIVWMEQQIRLQASPLETETEEF